MRMEESQGWSEGKGEGEKEGWNEGTTKVYIPRAFFEGMVSLSSMINFGIIYYDLHLS